MQNPKLKWVLTILTVIIMLVIFLMSSKPSTESREDSSFFHCASLIFLLKITMSSNRGSSSAPVKISMNSSASSPMSQNLPVLPSLLD